MLQQYITMAIENYWFSYGIFVILCAIGYAVEITRDTRSDVNKRAEYSRELAEWRELHSKDEWKRPQAYRPTVTIGTIFGGLVLTVTPALNIIAFVFHLLPRVYFANFSDLLDIPLVKVREPQS